MAALSAALGQSSPRERLGASPRHQEWVTVDNGARRVSLLVVCPEVKAKVPPCSIHENMGLTDWVRSVADQLADAGYIAVEGTRPIARVSTPHSKAATNFPGPGDGRPDRRGGVRAQDPGGQRTAFRGGLLLGRGASFRSATNRKGLWHPCALWLLRRQRRPRNDHHPEDAGTDARCRANLRAGDVRRRGPFMRAGDEPDASPANRKARQDAWAFWLALLKKR